MILADAKQLAADFMALLPQDCYRRAVVAGMPYVEPEGNESLDTPRVNLGKE